MHGISINSSLGIDLLSLRNVIFEDNKDKVKVKVKVIYYFKTELLEFLLELEKTKDYMKEKFTTYLYMLKVLSSSSPISLKS